MKLTPLLVGASLALLFFALSLSAEPVLKLGNLSAEASTQLTAKQFLEAAEQGPLSLDCTVEELLPYADVPNWRWYPAMNLATGPEAPKVQIDLGRGSYQADLAGLSWSQWRGLDTESIVILAWIQAGRCVELKPLKARSFEHWDGTAELKGSVPGGFPLVLAWSKGRLLPRTTWPAEMAEACRFLVSDDAAGLKSLLRGRGKAAVADADGNGLVALAIKLRAKACLRVLLSCNAPVLPRVGKKRTLRLSPMELAAGLNDLEAAQALYASKAKVSARSDALLSPLFLAASGGHLEMVRWLLEHNAAVDECSLFVILPLAAAIEKRQFAIAELLMAKGARFEVGDVDTLRTFLELCQEGHEEGVTLFVRKGVPATDFIAGRLPLVEAAKRGSPALAELLLSKGALVNAHDGRGRTALMNAAAGGNVAFAKVLLAAGADVSTADNTDSTALHEAALKGNPEMVSMLLEHGAPVGLPDKNGLTPFDYAVTVGSRECALMLLRMGGTLDHKSPLLDHKLEAILRSDMDEVLEQMLQSGLSPEYEMRGWRLAALARTVKAYRCLAVLNEAGADLRRPAPYALASAGSIQPGFKFSTDQQLGDPRPWDWNMPALKLKIKLLVDGSGEVIYSEIEECEDRELCLLLRRVSKCWHFTPPMKDGVRVAIWVGQEVSFPSTYELMHSNDKTFDTPPEVLYQSSPVYPPSLRRSGITGTAVVEFVLGRDGVPLAARCRVFNHPEFAGAGLRAVRSWRFKPATLKGKPVRVFVSLPLVFTLSD